MSKTKRVRKSRIVTAAALRKGGACDGGLANFRKVFGSQARITVEGAVLLAQCERFSALWLTLAMDNGTKKEKAALRWMDKQINAVNAQMSSDLNANQLHRTQAEKQLLAELTAIGTSRPDYLQHLASVAADRGLSIGANRALDARRIHERVREAKARIYAQAYIDAK